jgi:predicted lipoprotein with Yx(FWY)xxD motif
MVSNKETNDMDRQPRQMTSRLRAGGLAATALAIGGLSASAVIAGPAGAATSRIAKSVSVTTVKTSKGTVLASGKTLYTLKPSATPCTSACLKVWPALVLPKGVTKAKAGSGVTASKLGTKSRSGGVRQVTYGGKPLYYFVGDTAPGQVNGNVTDAWGKWSAVTAKGTSAGGSSSSGSSSGGSTAGSGGTAF